VVGDPQGEQSATVPCCRVCWGMTDRDTEFNWRVYAEATCAGLAVLIPFPFLDLFFELSFLGKMPRAVFAVRRVAVTEGQLAVLRRNDDKLFSARSCATVPVAAMLYVLKRISRKILYFLTIREATEKLSEHWHRAFLLDHIATRGFLTADPTAQVAKSALEATIKAADTSPLQHLARATIRRAGRVLRVLNRVRKRGPGPVIEAQEQRLEGAWEDLAGHFEALGAEFDRHFEAGLQR